jgi:type IV secretory pathway VirB4 component
MDPNSVNQAPNGQMPPAGEPAYGQYGPQPAVSSGTYVPPQPQQAYGPQQPMMPSSTPGLAPPPVVKPKTNPNSTQNALQIAEIRDGIVIMNDGSFRSVVMVKSINFDLMSPQEREGVEYSYQGFLNSLYFPIQIFLRSQRVDLRPYIEKLDKIRSEHENMLLALLMEDYVTYIDALSQQTNIMDKRFYVVIPYFPVADIQKAITQSKSFFSGLAGLFNNKEQHVIINEADLTKAKDELRNRVQAVLGGLQQSGIQGLPLDTQELIELYYDSYNPDTATRQQLKNFDDLTVPIVTRGEGMAPQPNLDKELPNG